MLVRALASTLELDTKRVQFTPDLMPSDITGSLVYDARTAEFSFQPGPVFTNLLLADEINRTPPKTQSSLLEAMEERQVTVDGTPPAPGTLPGRRDPEPGRVRGTYPLPEAQLDRFLLKLTILFRPVRTRSASSPATPRASTRATCAPPAYAPWRSRPTWRPPAPPWPRHRSPRNHRLRRRHLPCHPRIAVLTLGVSPRGATALLATARAWAWLTGRDYVIPDDVKALALPTLRHRIQLRPEAEMEGVTADSVINAILAHVPSPLMALTGRAALLAALGTLPVGIWEPSWTGILAVNAPGPGLRLRRRPGRTRTPPRPGALRRHFRTPRRDRRCHSDRHQSLRPPPARPPP